MQIAIATLHVIDAHRLIHYRLELSSLECGLSFSVG
jgi:hypothetical protein